MNNRSILIALPLEEELLEPLRFWGQRFDWSSFTTVHLLHVVKKNITPLEFGLMEMPDEKTYREMVPPLRKFLSDEASKILPQTWKGELQYHLETDFNPQEVTVNFIKRLKPQLIVVSTRGKHGFQGLFHSSFTDHMVRFAPCDVYVVRPEASP